LFIIAKRIGRMTGRDGHKYMAMNLKYYKILCEEKLFTFYFIVRIYIMVSQFSISVNISIS